MGLFKSRIETREAYDREMTGQAFDELASSVVARGKPIPFSADDIPPSDKAVVACLYYLGVEPGKAPEQVERLPDRIEWICRPSGTMYRQVQLTEKWYRRSFGVMLGTLASGESVCLVPFGINGYRYRDPKSGQMIRVSDRNAKDIDSQALLFYKPLPCKAVRIRELAGFIASAVQPVSHLILFLTALAITLIGLLPPAASHFAFTMVIPSGQASLIFPVGIFLFGTSLASAIVSACRNLFMARISLRLTVISQAAFFSRILSLPVSFFRKYNPGDLASRVQSISIILQTGVSSFLGAGLSVILALIFVFQIHVYAPVLSVPVLAVTLVQVLIIAAAVRSGARYRQASMTASSRLSGSVAALLNGVQKIKLAGAENRAFAKWAHQYAAYARNAYHVPIIVRAAPAFVTLAGMLGTVWFYKSAGSAEISVSNYMAFSAAYGAITAAVSALAAASVQMAQIKPLYSLLRPVLETCPETSSAMQGVEALTGSIELSDLSFRYSDNDPYVISNLSLKIRPGEYVAVVGKSGCGKSTLLKLLLGMETPEMGSVFYDNYDIRTVNPKSLRRHIGVVMQDGKLLAGDIRTNITFAAPEATLDDAWEAAELAGIAEDIRKMPMGMNTIISEGSGGISGGQRQRILIARAICGKRRILFFDEATSALDNKMQKQISDSLDRLACTRIVIAHRLSTVRNCDRILVLDQGRIAEEGAYEELYDRKGLFYHLVKRQQPDL